MKQRVVFYPRLEAKLSRRTSTAAADAWDWLGRLPYWCGNKKLHLEMPGDYHTVGCCFNHVIGLPLHPHTREPMPLTAYQVDMFRRINKRTTNPGRGGRARYRFFLINKGRQMGFTEGVLRIKLYYSFGRHKGRRFGIMAATNGKLASKDIRRLYGMFKNIKSALTGPLKNNRLELVNGSTFEAFPASEEALTGDTNYGSIFLDEAAKWKLVDDTPVFNSIMPIARTNKSDVYLVSTPKGPVKTFYQTYKDPGDFEILEYDIWKAKGSLYTEGEIRRMLETTTEDPNQEYLCKFTHGENAIFRGLVEENVDPSLTEWDTHPAGAADSPDTEWDV